MYAFFGFVESAATLAATSATSSAIPAAPILGFFRRVGFSSGAVPAADSAAFLTGSVPATAVSAVSDASGSESAR